MKIYFSGAIRGGRKNSGIYAQVIDFLKQYGDVLTHHVGDNNIEKQDEQLTDKNIHADFELSAMISGCKDLEVLCYNHLSDAFPEIERFLSRINGSHHTV